MAEALLGVLGGKRFAAFSAGSHPSGRVQPLATELCAQLGYPPEKLRSKGWDEYAMPGAPSMDFVITVCDDAAGEICPIWPRQPIAAHWGVPDPAAVAGSEETRRAAFRDAFMILRRRVELLAALPLDKLDRLARERHVRAIADASAVDAVGTA
jgi:arsenate reductase